MLKKLMSLTLALLLTAGSGSSVPEPAFGCALYLDGTQIGVCAHRKELAQVWKSVELSILPDGAEPVSRVTVVHQAVSAEELCSPAELLQRIREELVYTVTEYRTQPFSARTQYVETESLPRGEREVLDPGSPGLLQTEERVTYQNGTELNRRRLASGVIRDALARTVAVGTRWTCGLPVAEYVLTSDFGPRNGGDHTGIDLAAPMETPVCAAEAGTVVFSGWQGGYGLLVRLDHGNGFETWYAHNSAASVEPGQTVRRGETIALMGSTGNSTGSHCHFEVRRDGAVVNPWDHLTQ